MDSNQITPINPITATSVDEVLAYTGIPRGMFLAEQSVIRYALCVASPKFFDRVQHAWLIDLSARITVAERNADQQQGAATCERHWERLRERFFGDATPALWNGAR